MGSGLLWTPCGVLMAGNGLNGSPPFHIGQKLGSCQLNCTGRVTLNASKSLGLNSL